ncbi:DNA-binding transcriptional regulator, MerR family [Pseudomonas flavescens]|uniref:DNA-binding transcriptional regulator, MerR family n=1 Tax=Phytopseudomonas flavescens TaxID=29435 RepID=A0A1G8GFH4_9GAMM|nr:MerR family transcriptional regulator [Pseudomonas flavescens]SDH93037.1 DNA-binding transcriptional regulator, MerR family [Pseudomonas flavescens]
MNQPRDATGGADPGREAFVDGYLPIREVASLTGVNPVTLRAWERRYGLIVPHRTAKGHRLYSAEHVQTIKAVLGWLNRGVSVGQVKGLLRVDQPLPAEQSSQWQEKRERLCHAIHLLDERQLDERFNAELALYPPQILCQHLLLPLLDTLERRWPQRPGATTERLFLYSWLRSKLGARVYHDNRQHTGKPLLLINLGPLPMSPQLWLCAWLIGTAGCPVDAFDGPIPPNELPLAIARRQPRALLLFCETENTSGKEPSPRQWLADHGIPCLLVGFDEPSGTVPLPANAASGADIVFTAGPLAALQTLADRHLLE